MAKKSVSGKGAPAKAASGSKKAAPKASAKRTPSKAPAASKPVKSKPNAGKAVPAAKAKAQKAAVDPALAARLAEGKKLEKIDARKETAKPATRARGVTAADAARSAHPFRNAGFPKTYIKLISVELDDPDHRMTLTWTGPDAAAQETGPFRTSPGAGLKGLNCDDTATSRRSGSNCTPKGTFTVEGFAPHLPSHAVATYVTWFLQRRGIACHFFPSVPRFAASHGCVRIEQERVARLVQDNARVDLTSVTVAGTWTKPKTQY